MHASPVILNNTPLVALWLLDQLTLLRDLFRFVLIPSAVEMEFLAAESAMRKQALEQSHWIKTVSVQNPRHALTYTGLDQGEAEVLALGVEQGARLVVIDERKGRQYAKRLGLPLTGTLGLLLVAKEKRLITQVAPYITRLETAGLYFHPTLVRRVLVLAEEPTNI